MMVSILFTQKFNEILGCTIVQYSFKGGYKLKLIYIIHFNIYRCNYIVKMDIAINILYLS
jgi:hypothetical protein